MPIQNFAKMANNTVCLKIEKIYITLHFLHTFSEILDVNIYMLYFQRSFFRTMLMIGFHLAVSYIGSIKGIKDTQCGFKLFTRNAANILFKNMHIERWLVTILFYINHDKYV